MKTIAVVGGSLAGLSTARALRHQGFDGRLFIISGERHRPYDRPPLSKTYLAGTVTDAEIALEAADEDLDADWRFGVTALALDPSGRRLDLSDGSALVADGVVLATGASPRSVPGTPRLAGAHVLRSVDDSRSLREDLRPGARLVVVGAGFIGAEVASTARGLGLEVVVVEAASHPLSGPIGAEMGSVVASLHTRHGVELTCGMGVVGLIGGDRVTGVALADGRVVDADVVLVGIGVRPNTEWLRGSGLAAAEGVICDAYGATPVANVVAVGDCAAWYEPALGRHVRFEHWTAARERGAIAAATLLSGGTEFRSGRPPYFWSDQYGLTIQIAGHIAGADSIVVEEGSTADCDFLAVYRRRADPVAVLAMGRGKSFMHWRRQLATAAVSARQE
ncbi:MAG TPA: FAD-dependent oxidoreductase [Mycobacterium sp.]|nr:FAD-dependent oxidoreductase [Micromonosporaceae bacterium]